MVTTPTWWWDSHLMTVILCKWISWWPNIMLCLFLYRQIVHLVSLTRSTLLTWMRNMRCCFMSTTCRTVSPKLCHLYCSVCVFTLCKHQSVWISMHIVNTFALDSGHNFLNIASALHLGFGAFIYACRSTDWRCVAHRYCRVWQRVLLWRDDGHCIVSPCKKQQKSYSIDNINLGCLVDFMW